MLWVLDTAETVSLYLHSNKITSLESSANEHSNLHFLFAIPGMWTAFLVIVSFLRQHKLIHWSLTEKYARFRPKPKLATQ